MEPTIDFSECEREPLRTPGFIQPHGTLIAFKNDLKVSHAGENARTYFGRAPEWLLNQHLAAFCSSADVAAVERTLLNLPEGQLTRVPWQGASRPCDAWVHVAGGVYVLELEATDTHAEPEPAGATDAIREYLDITAITQSVETLAQRTAETFAAVALYDRVMIYQFHEDWSGQVIAEHRPAAAEPYLGLRYPATDIPSQARELYTVNHLRVLSNVEATPAALLARPGEQALDLTYAMLRSMSPYHIEYLRNMNVSATLNASILVNGRLWGLISCHHLTAKTVPAFVREAARLMAQTFSKRIAEMRGQSAARANSKMAWQLRALAGETASAENIVETLCFGNTRLNTLFQLDSMAIHAEGALISVGDAPPADWITTFVEQILPLEQDVFAFSEMQGGLACSPCEEATGALALILSRNPAVVILGFRNELEQELTWGGDIRQAAVRTEGAERLSPRKSFAAYKQTIHGKSLPWTVSETEKGRQLVAVLRGLLPSDPLSASRIFSRGIQRLFEAVPSPSSLARSLLDLASEGMSLFVNRRGESAIPAFASQALLTQFDLDDNGPEFSMTIGDFFRHIGMPDDLLHRAHFGPQEVRVLTGRCANRTYVVQLKQMIDVTVSETHASLLVLTFSDMTKQARMLETSEAAQKRAEHANRIKSTFLANTTHEVRTPMNGILGVAQLLKDTPLTAEQAELVQIIERSGTALLQIVNDILDFSKVEAGKLTLESVSFNLHSLLQEVMQLFRPMASPQVDLRLTISPDVPALLIGDPGRLRQVVVNLLGNAVKFTPQGQVTLSVRVERASAVHVTLAFKVQDSGVGMPAHKAAKLFDRFDQADASISRKYGGSGLGLSISKELVTLMGGHIFATSKPGEGTSIDFRLSFVVDQPDASIEPEASIHQMLSLSALADANDTRNTAPPTDPRASLRVLLVDDNAINLKVASAMLARESCLVTVAANGTDAIALYLESEYDVILMDCQMPDMDGCEAAAQIRKAEAGRRRTPIIALTASIMADEHDRCFAAGMDEIMLKPVEVQKLRVLVKHWGRRSADTVPSLSRPADE